MIALLPMKKDSIRVPNKNLKSLCGKPLFFHIADTLKESEKFHQLVINTDSDLIGDFAKNRYGNWVRLIERPIFLQDANTSMLSILDYDVDQIGQENHFFQTHSTNPFVEAKTIIHAVDKYLKMFQSGVADSLFSVNSVKKRFYNKDVIAINHDQSNLLPTQLLEPVYLENSNFYIFSGHTLKLHNHRIGGKPIMYEMQSELESIDIDEQEDWQLAEIYCKFRSL